jgi:hypothetical protein
MHKTFYAHPMAGENTCWSRMAISQLLAGRRSRGKMCRLLIIASDLRLRRMRNGDVK